MENSNRKMIDKYLSKNEMFVSVEAKNSQLSESGNIIPIFIAPEIYYKEIFPDFDYKNKNDVEESVSKVVPYILDCIKLFYNRENNCFETVILPNPYFRNVFIANNDINGLCQFLSEAFNSFEEDGIETEKYVRFVPEKFTINIKKKAS